MRLIAADAMPTQASESDYAELAILTTVYHCVTCGPILREHLPDGNRITWHRTIPHHPAAQLHGEELLAMQ